MISKGRRKNGPIYNKNNIVIRKKSKSLRELRKFQLKLVIYISFPVSRYGNRIINFNLYKNILTKVIYIHYTHQSTKEKKIIYFWRIGCLLYEEKEIRKSLRQRQKKSTLTYALKENYPKEN